MNGDLLVDAPSNIIVAGEARPIGFVSRVDQVVVAAGANGLAA